MIHNTITTVTTNVTELNQLPTSVELVSGPTFNSLIPSSATRVEFLCETPWITSGTILSTTNSTGPIYGNLEGTTWKVSTPARNINANTNCSQMFKNKNNLTSIIFNGLNTSNVTNMSSMFEGCSALTILDLSSLNTSNVTNMSSMFKGCYNVYLNLLNFNTQNVTDMSYMFYFCSGLHDPNLSSFNTSNVTDMSYMFYCCKGLYSLNLSSFNTSNVTDMSYMFAYCSNSNYYHDDEVYQLHIDYSGLTHINLSSFNTSNVTNMSGMFCGCHSLSSLNLSNFNTQNVTDMSYMFASTSEVLFNDYDDFGYYFGLSSLDLSNFNTSSVTNMSYMFSGCYCISSLYLSNFDMSNVTSKTGMCSGLSIKTGSATVHHDHYNFADWSNGSCTITCPLSVQTAMQSGAGLPSPDEVTFTWVRP